MIPKIIHYCWLSNNKIPEEFQVYINSWKDKLSDYLFILWDFNRFDINISLWVKQAFEAKKYAFAADFIRLYAVYYFGGIYLDMDIEVIKPFDDLLNADYLFAYEDNITMSIEAGCFGAEKNSFIIKNCLNYYYQREFIKTDGGYDMLPLPQIMRDVFNKFNINMHFFTSDYFTAKCFKTGIINVTKNTYCVHHFAGSWINESDKYYLKKEKKIISIFGDNKFSKIIIRTMYILRKFKDIGFMKALKYYFNKFFNYAIFFNYNSCI
jgi:mannosyltransferase OCH1-like enzyme